mmetsp:Transcript_38096/g.91905  ORF Transcript_38096/g.91905 Transcript_38096/m.91905 type:complete len:251 (-) Transcript_38096:451-1203(-)
MAASVISVAIDGLLLASFAFVAPRMPKDGILSTTTCRRSLHATPTAPPEVRAVAHVATDPSSSSDDLTARFVVPETTDDLPPPSRGVAGTLSTTALSSSSSSLPGPSSAMVPRPSSLSVLPAVVTVPNVVTLAMESSPASVPVLTDRFVVPLATLLVASGMTSTNTALSITMVVSISSSFENSRPRLLPPRASTVSSTSVSKMEPRSPMVVMVAKDATLRSSGKKLPPPPPPIRTAPPVTPDAVEDLIPP